MSRGVGALHISIIITVIIAELVLRYHSSNLRRSELDTFAYHSAASTCKRRGDRHFVKCVG